MEKAEIREKLSYILESMRHLSDEIEITCTHRYEIPVLGDLENMINLTKRVMANLGGA